MLNIHIIKAKQPIKYQNPNWQLISKKKKKKKEDEDKVEL